MQAQNIKTVNLAVTETDKITRQNANEPEKSAIVSEEMNTQSAKMEEIVDQFVT